MYTSTLKTLAFALALLAIQAQSQEDYTGYKDYTHAVCHTPGP